MSPSRKSAPAAVVGLDIGSDTIKVAEARFAKDGITITGLGVARTPEGAVENEVIMDSKALGTAVKALLAESGIKTRKCVSSVGGQSQVVVRVIEVPKMSKDELAETMKWEVERHVPFSPQEVVKDFQPLDRPNADPDAQNMEVLLAVAQQDLIQSHVEALQLAGLQPMAIDIEPLAASRSLIEASTNGAKNEVVAILNIGSNRTDLGFFDQGVLIFPSPPLGIAGISFTREIAEALGQTLEEAEVSKKEYAAVHLDAFASASQPDDAPAASPEPTSFSTVFTPFGVDDQPAAPEAPADEPAQFGSFANTVDGPVFDTPDVLAAPAFDLGDEGTGDPQPAGAAASAEPGAGSTDAPVGPTFDLGDEGTGDPVPAAPAAPTDLGGPAFDLGGATPLAAEPASLDFDLDDEPAHKEDEPAAPAFDLTDTDVHADPGQQAAAVVHAPAPKPGSMEDAVFQSISNVLIELANELRRSVEYYSTKYSTMPQRVFLCGGTAKMPNLGEFLSREMGMPVQIADPLKNLRVNVPGCSDQYLKEISPLFSVCIGLAIRDMIG